MAQELASNHRNQLHELVFVYLATMVVHMLELVDGLEFVVDRKFVELGVHSFVEVAQRFVELVVHNFVEAVARMFVVV